LEFTTNTVNLKFIKIKKHFVIFCPDFFVLHQARPCVRRRVARLPWLRSTNVRLGADDTATLSKRLSRNTGIFRSLYSRKFVTRRSSIVRISPL